MRLSRQFQASLFFLRKDFEREKTQNKKKANKKQQRQRFSKRIKTSKRVEIVRFEFSCFLYAQNLFVKKIINWLEIVLIASFTVLLQCLINRPL